MTREDESQKQVSMGVECLDDLDLLRAGVLGPDALARPAPWLSAEIPREVSDRNLEVTDAEGVPIARLSWDARGELTEPAWLARRSARPFEELHLGAASPAGTVVVVDGPVTTQELEGAVAAAAAPLRFLVLASTEGQGQDSIGTVRRVRTVRERHPGADLVVVPLGQHASRRAEKRARAIAAYSDGAEVLDLGQGDWGSEPGRAGQGLVIFFTGLSGSGKSTVARAVRNHILETTERTVTLLDGDLVRRNLSRGLGFSAQDRDTNIRRIGWVAAEVARHGGIAVCSPIAPFGATRRAVRQMVEEAGGRFVLVHVTTPLEECERRDRKGLYARARRGEIPDFTGISSPYETPDDADLVIDTTGQPVQPLRDAVLDVVGHAGGLGDPAGGLQRTHSTVMKKEVGR